MFVGSECRKAAYDDSEAVFAFALIDALAFLFYVFVVRESHSSDPRHRLALVLVPYNCMSMTVWPSGTELSWN